MSNFLKRDGKYLETSEQKIMKINKTGLSVGRHVIEKGGKPAVTTDTGEPYTITVAAE
jgi:hypothetical protein